MFKSFSCVFAVPLLLCAALLPGCKYFQRPVTPTASIPPPMTPPQNGQAASPSPAALLPYDSSVLAQISPRSQNNRVPVIMYHDVVRNRHGESAVVNALKAEFEENIRYLEEQGATFISLEQLHRHLTRGEAVPFKSVVLTFDDNYQGFYDNAYPLLKAKKYPAAVFVHTNFVGDKKGSHPKMDWETLQALDKEGLITICSHTLSHPADLTKLPIETQDEELVQSKATMERELGHAVPFFAYPYGKGDKNTFDTAQRAGYTMAFTMNNGPTEESPGILVVNRYNYTNLQKGWEQCRDAALNAPAAVYEATVSPTPVLLRVEKFEGVKLGMVRGGTPMTWQSPSGGRRSVGEFVADAAQKLPSAPPVAGMNGTFFADANLRGTGNAMIGPCQTTAEGLFRPDAVEYRLPKLLNRPLVIWGPSRFAIVPFNASAMNNDASLHEFMPDFTDVFLAGAWIVHDGQARTKEEMSAYSARDFNDPRRRAFFGIADSGDVILGGTLDVVTTEQMARAVAAAGVKEAVLMDSGFSTSIVYNNRIIVTGHTAKNLPSRPVPHAIVVSGTLQAPTDPDTLAILEKAEPAVGKISASEAQANAPGGSQGNGRRSRRRR